MFMTTPVTSATRMQVCGANRRTSLKHECVQQLSSVDSIFSGSFDANPLSLLICGVEESEAAAQQCGNEAVQIKKQREIPRDRGKDANGMREENTKRRSEL